MIQISEIAKMEWTTSFGIAIMLSVSYWLWHLIFLETYKIGSILITSLQMGKLTVNWIAQDPSAPWEAEPVYEPEKVLDDNTPS